VKDQAMNRLLKTCYAILNAATGIFLFENCAVIGKTNVALIRTSPRNFSSNSTNIYANSKISFIHQS